MTPVERGCLYGIGILGMVFMITHGVEAWFEHLTDKYWEQKAGR